MWRASLTPISALIGQSVSCSCRGTAAAVPSKVYKHVQHPALPQYVTCVWHLLQLYTAASAQYPI